MRLRVLPGLRREFLPALALPFRGALEIIPQTTTYVGFEPATWLLLTSDLCHRILVT
jgi:hypothetical protein